MYPVIQAYGSLALEDNSKIGEVILDRCSISCICTIHTISQISSLTMGPSERRLGDFPSLWSEGRRFDSLKDLLQKGLECYWYTSSWFLSQNSVPLRKVGCMIANGVFHKHGCWCGWGNMTHLRGLSHRPSWHSPFPWTLAQREGRPVNTHTYLDVTTHVVRICCWDLNIG